MLPVLEARDLRQRFLLRREVALFDVRTEARFAEAHPLFASSLPHEHLEAELALRVPRKNTPVVFYDGGEGLASVTAERAQGLGYQQIHLLHKGLAGWREAGYELFQDVNSASKAFGELVEHRRHTPSLPADEVHALLESRADLVVLDARPFGEYHTMSIPSATNVPGAELVLRARALAPERETTIVVNCAGRTRSIIGAQSLINAGISNQVVALRNGTIGWTLAGRSLEQGQERRAPKVDSLGVVQARQRAQDVAYRAGVRTLTPGAFADLRAETTRTLYLFDVRSPEEFVAGHLPGFRNVPGGQLVQELDHHAPVRGARAVLADPIGPRADMTASWLAQLGVEVYVLEDRHGLAPRGFAPGADFGGPLEGGEGPRLLPRPAAGRYRRPYEGTDHAREAMQAYLDWELGLVEQLARDGTHGFTVLD